jgi:GNAT superfamily N-acetyltransferase
MALRLKEVETKRELNQFITYPLKLYKNNPYYVPAMVSDEINTLSKDKNPAFAYCEARYWLAYQDGKIVGRIAGIINPKHNQKWNDSHIRFGWLDFEDDPAISAALLGAVEDWGRQKGLKAIHGPLGFTDLDREALLIEGFDEVATLATLYNYPYYPDHLDQLGYEKDTDWVEYELTMPEKLDERIARAAQIVLKRHNLHLLEAKTKRDLLPYTTKLFEMINSEYSHLYGSTPLSPEEIQHYTDAYFGFAHPDFVPMILNEQNELVAFGVTFPSLSKALQKSGGKLFPFGWARILHALAHNDRADLYLVAVRKEYQGMGVNMVLMNQVWEAFLRRGIKKVETNPELEDNLNVQSQWKVIEKRQHKRRRCYIKPLK